MQKQLRRFTHRAHKEQEGNHIRRIPLSPQERHRLVRQIWCSSKDIIKADAIRHQEQREYPQRKAEIAHPVDHKGLDRRRVRAWFLVVKPDQQIGRDTHAFPTKEHLHEVVRRDQHQHREGEKAKIGKETRAVAHVFCKVLIVGHVAKAIKMHEA